MKSGTTVEFVQGLGQLNALAEPPLFTSEVETLVNILKGHTTQFREIYNSRSCMGNKNQHDHIYVGVR